MQIDVDGRIHGDKDRLSVVTSTDDSIADVIVEAKIHVVEGGTGQHLSLLVRHRGVEDGGQCYAALFTFVGSLGISLWKVDNGWQEIASTSPVGFSSEFVARFEAVGSQLQIFINDQLVIACDDASVQDEGWTGLRALGDGIRISKFRAYPALAATTSTCSSDVSGLTKT